ncbi:MAG: hypothetical protein PF503_17750 [Desulfobacula sp.]|nr:hypothetical protein [Desulfobacula sp.]
MEKLRIKKAVYSGTKRGVIGLAQSTAMGLFNYGIKADEVI